MNKTRYSATEFGRNKPMNFRPSGTLIGITMGIGPMWGSSSLTLYPLLASFYHKAHDFPLI